MSTPTLGELIDSYYLQRADRLELERKAKKMKEREAELEQQIMGALHNVNLKSGRGNVATATITVKTVPTVVDWDQVYGFVKEQDDFSLLNRRITVETWKEYKDSGVLVPGTEAFDKFDLSLTKATR